MAGWRLRWQHWAIMLRRLPRDRRARRHLFLVVYFALVVVLELVNIAVHPYIIPALFLMALLVGGALWLLTRSKRGDEQALLKLTTPVIPSEPAISSESHRKALVRHLGVETAWTCRALSEAVLKNASHDTDGSTTGLRAKTIQLLRETDAWDQLPPEQRAEFMAPEGSWTHAQIDTHAQSRENALVLLWTVGLGDLAPIALTLSPAFRPLLDLCHNPSLLQGAKPIQSTPELRMARREAAQYFDRCLWELERRAQTHEGVGFFANNEDRLAFLESHRSSRWDDDNEDLLLGSESVHRASEDAIRFALRVSYARYWSARGILDLLEGPPGQPLLLRPPTLPEAGAAEPASLAEANS